MQEHHYLKHYDVLLKVQKPEKIFHPFDVLVYLALTHTPWHPYQIFLESFPFQ